MAIRRGSMYIVNELMLYLRLFLLRIGNRAAFVYFACSDTVLSAFYAPSVLLIHVPKYLYSLVVEMPKPSISLLNFSS